MLPSTVSVTRKCYPTGVHIIYLGDEEEFYQGEIRDMVLGTLDEALSATEKATRKADVLEDILDNNPYYHLSDDRKQRIKALFKGYKNLTGAMRQELLSLGFEIRKQASITKLHTTEIRDIWLQWEKRRVITAAEVIMRR